MTDATDTPPPTVEDLADLQPIHRALAAVQAGLSHNDDGSVNQALVTPGLLQQVKQRGLVDHFLMVDHKAGDPLPVGDVKLGVTSKGEEHLAVLAADPMAPPPPPDRPVEPPAPEVAAPG